MPLAPQDALAEFSARSRTPLAWAQSVLQDPLSLLIDHAILEKKAANNAMDMLTRWPGDLVPGWVETMTSVARDEAAHLSHVVRILPPAGGRLNRSHQNPYAKDSASWSARANRTKRSTACSFPHSSKPVPASASPCSPRPRQTDPELAAFYNALFSSELGHFNIFLKLAYKLGERAELDARWDEMLAHEAPIIEAQKPGPRIHSGLPAI